MDKEDLDATLLSDTLKSIGLAGVMTKERGKKLKKNSECIRFKDTEMDIVVK